MASSGITNLIPGTNGIVTVDEKYQIIVDAQAHADGHEAKHVGEVIERVESTFRKLDSNLDIYREVVLTEKSGQLICPAGKPMRWRTRTYTGRGFSGYVKHCTNFSLRSKCIRGTKTKMRNITIIDRTQTSIQKMIDRLDTERGRHYDSRRMGTVEPAFANITSTLELDRFSLR